jgi:hypothetical protein
MGWTLETGYIKRGYKSDDHYLVMDGVSQKLILVKEENGIREWRTESSDGAISKIYSVKKLAYGFHLNERWKVLTADGTTYYYGTTGDSRVAGLTGHLADLGYLYWHLERVVDANGNTMEITYNSSKYPQQISYSGHASADGTSDMNPTHKVVFIWESRADKAYRNDHPRLGLRLKGIEATAGGQAAGSYVLHYGNDNETGYSLLKSVERVGTDGKEVLPRMEMAYSFMDAGCPDGDRGCNLLETMANGSGGRYAVEYRDAMGADPTGHSVKEKKFGMFVKDPKLNTHIIAAIAIGAVTVIVIIAGVILMVFGPKILSYARTNVDKAYQISAAVEIGETYKATTAEAA